MKKEIKAFERRMVGLNNMTNYDRYILNNPLVSMSPEDLVDSSIYVEYVPDYDEGIDGETYQCGEIEYWKTTLNNDFFYSYEEVIEYTINWLKSEESWETLGCEKCIGYGKEKYNYGCTERCNDCIWSPYNDENNPKNKDRWEIDLKKVIK